MNALAILVVFFSSALLLSAPIAVVIGLSALVAIYAAGFDPLEICATSMLQGVDSFALLAIPFFILSGMIMGKGSMAKRLMDFASALVRFLPGGLAYVNTITCMLFGAISGSAVAAVSSIGSFMIPQMEKKCCDKETAVAITICSSTTGMLIPPSNIMIVYSVAVGGLSIGALFMAGIIPGIVLGICIMAASYFIIRKNRSPKEGSLDFSLIWSTFRRAFLSLMLVVVVLGGILCGIFTATESAVISVVYALLLEVFVYRDISSKELFKILAGAAATTGIVMLIVAASSAMSWILTMTNAPAKIAEALSIFGDSRIAILIVINIILLFVGMFMDMTPAVLIFTPILLPVVREIGVSDLHFGIIMISNLSIGLCTPPVGTCLFVGCGVGKTDISRLTPKMLPYFAAMLVAQILVTFIPDLSTALPEMLGMVSE